MHVPVLVLAVECTRRLRVNYISTLDPDEPVGRTL